MQNMAIIPSNYAKNMTPHETVWRTHVVALVGLLARFYMRILKTQCSLKDYVSMFDMLIWAAAHISSK